MGAVLGFDHAEPYRGQLGGPDRELPRSEAMTTQLPTADLAPAYDVVVIGAGVGGIYQIKRLADLGVDAVVLEADDDLGGTWYRNRYPGARFDSESYTYGYSFSQKILDEWHWKEHFSGQPENLRYLNFVADTFDLRQHMRFNCRVESMRFDETADQWTLCVGGAGGQGREITANFVVTAMGLLSVPTPPRFEGMDSFEGQSFHTYHWPKEPLDLSDLRVGVIGTGATGIQVIGEIADKVKELTVFQRRPNWSAPLNNGPISEEEMAEIRSRYDEIFAECAQSPGGFVHSPDRRGFYNFTAEERRAMWDELYEGRGFGIWLQNFSEIFMDEGANDEFSAYIADRIRQRVNDPEIAEKLIPKDHGFGYQRVPMETNYFEVYNQPNVRLVDVSETPIQEITAAGVLTSAEEHDLDLIVYATGFDAITGAFDKIDIEGTGGRKLRDEWRDSPSTFMGMMMHGYPNLVMVAGPQSGSASTNFPRGIETGVDWATDLLQHMWKNGHRRWEATAEAQANWTQHVIDMYQIMLMRKAKGWFTGYNSNVEGHEEGSFRPFVYNGGAPKFQMKLDAEADTGYPNIAFE